jgi:phosphoribosylcarboxyaminoimidazole (NCAIR) mutase
MADQNGKVVFISETEPHHVQLLFITEDPNGFRLLQESRSSEILEKVDIKNELIVDIKLSEHLQQQYQIIPDATVYIIIAQNCILSNRIFRLKKNALIIVAATDDMALSSITQNPSSIPLLCSGVGSTGLKKATIAAAQIIGLSDPKIKDQIDRYLET